MALVKALRQVSRAEDVRNDTKLLMQPYANWEEFLTPAPISIGILGELVFISSNDDFSISKNPPPDGFKFIRYPDSFRACLMQVVNAGWNAFNEAHRNMDQIRLHSANVGGYVKAAVIILLKGDNQLIEVSLPKHLATIQEISESCTELANATEKKFQDVINIIQELMEQSINAKAAYNDELEETKMTIEASKLREKAAEESKRRSEECSKQLNREITEAQDNYKKAMDSMPSGWKVIGLNFVEGLANSFTTLMNAGTKVAAMIFSNPAQAETVVASNYVYSKSPQILPLVELMNGFVDEGQIKWDDLYDRKQESSKSAFLRQQFKQVEDSVKKQKECKPATKCLAICKKAIDICQKMESIGPGKKGDDKLTKELTRELENLRKMAAEFDTQSKSFTGSSAFSVTAPEMAKSQQGISGTAGQMAVDNARFRIEQARAQLNGIKDLMQKTTDSLTQTQNELTDVMIKLQNCQVKEIDFATTIKMLTTGLEAMGKVKEQWGKMVCFFQMTTNIVGTCMNRSLKDFVQTAQTPTAQLEYSSRKFMTNMLYNQALQSSNIAFMVTMIAGTYTEVSNRFLMDGISGLGKLMAMDPSRREFTAERMKLQDGCKEAERGIRLLAQKNIREFDTNAAARLAKIEREFQAVMPPASEDEINKIKDLVDSGMMELTAEEEDQYT